jgi:hypothetical protein
MNASPPINAGAQKLGADETEDQQQHHAVVVSGMIPLRDESSGAAGVVTGERRGRSSSFSSKYSNIDSCCICVLISGSPWALLCHVLDDRGTERERLSALVTIARSRHNHMHTQQTPS